MILKIYHIGLRPAPTGSVFLCVCVCVFLPSMHTTVYILLLNTGYNCLAISIFVEMGLVEKDAGDCDVYFRYLATMVMEVE